MKFRLSATLFLVFFLGATVFAAGPVDLSDIQTALIEENYQKVHDLSKQFIRQNPGKELSDQAQYYLGLSLLWLNNPEEAKEVFHELTMYKPEVSVLDRAYIGMIDAHFMEGHYRESIEEAQGFLKKRPDSEFISLVYLKLARAHLKLADWTTAKGYLKKIIQNYSHSPEAHSAQQLLNEKHYFAVQVGAFLNVDRANKLSEQLQQQGQYAYTIETTDRAGRQFYRVRVGKLSRLDEAKKLKKTLSKLGYPTQIYP